MSLATGRNAWEFDATTSQYYYHSRPTEQPDTQLAQSGRAKAMHDSLRFGWRAASTDFRVRYPLAPREGPAVSATIRSIPTIASPTIRRTALHPAVQRRSAGHHGHGGVELRRVLEEFPVTGRSSASSICRWRADGVLRPHLNAAHMPFNFSLLWAAGRARNGRPSGCPLIRDYRPRCRPGPGRIGGASKTTISPRVATRLGAARPALPWSCC